ncbi:MAG: hypothetical protein QOJ35_2677 [Solirubrobacteraceae bacterium]|nr:hypothetical protein [Solirubrobacteraceae bacterium]
MTSAGARVAAFVALLAVIFAVAVIAGGILDPGAGDAAHGAAGHGAAARPATARPVIRPVGDLAYRHVHPLAEPGLAFHRGASEPGTYRMFLRFRDRGRVHPVAFTRTFRR